jgi:hypothetical protein
MRITSDEAENSRPSQALSGVLTTGLAFQIRVAGSLWSKPSISMEYY